MSSGWDAVLPPQRAQVRSHMLLDRHGPNKTNKTPKELVSTTLPRFRFLVILCPEIILFMSSFTHLVNDIEDFKLFCSRSLLKPLLRTKQVLN